CKTATWLQNQFQGCPGIRRLTIRHLFRNAGADDSPAAGAAFRPQVDQPVGGLEDVQIVLNDDYGVPGINESMPDMQQLLDVVEVQAGGRLVENVEGLTGAAFAQLAGQLDSLGLPTGQRRRRLAELDVIQPHVVQRLQHRPDLGYVREMIQGLLHVHLQDFMDIFALEADLERLAVKAATFTDWTSHPHVGQEVHLQAIRAVAFTPLAAAARALKAKSLRFVTPTFVLRQLGVQGATVIVPLDVSRLVRVRRSAHVALIQ